MAQDYQITRLVRDAKTGDERAFSNLLDLIEPDLKKIASHYFILGHDREDVLQELRIGVYKAVQSYDENKDTTFKSFCINLVCKRHISTAIHAARRYKNSILNEAVSLDAPVVLGEDGALQTLAEFIPDRSNPLDEDGGETNMLDVIITREELDLYAQMLQPLLTQLELDIYNQYTYDSSYKDIADQLGIQPKCVDNALMRIRKKAIQVREKCIGEDDESDDLADSDE